MLEIKAAYYRTLIERLDYLLIDLYKSNPEYGIASDIAQNPVITSLTKELRKNPLDYVAPTRKGVIFHLDHLKDLRSELAAKLAVELQVAQKVFEFELGRIGAINDIQISIIDNKFRLQNNDYYWIGDAESVINHVLLLEDGAGVMRLLDKINT
ncbi:MULTISPECIES: hypothetical protein [unclassified Paenibacillus]|uniref:hypothetical protein n=1 Tax=unclassified Paenibacillus TaxID=185978 RepID=UPI00278766A0|nr:MULTISPECIES: hypothetical protein [unclassified Paenibacillus]MDQ0896324.1 hypothetical protein [Paenibacillus sp. V4I7]MDQ0913750.1 hypothetical protein [Paenibacillus sp. V4I5]